MQNPEQQPVHFRELQTRFPDRSDAEIGDAIERRKIEIGASANREEILTILTAELS